jgi:hypothetical protein
LNLVLCQLVHVLGKLAPGEDATVDYWVKCFHPTI